MVSIITPTYLRDELLKETVLSVLNQTVFDWELLVVDDAISGETEDLIKSFADKRVKYLPRTVEQKGAPACRNIGIKNAIGKYIMFLDSDDLMVSSCLEQRLDAFNHFEGYDFLVFQTGFFKEKIGDTPVFWNRFDDRNDLIRFLNADTVWHTSGSFFKRDSLINNQILYNEVALTSQDWLFHIDVLLSNMKYKKPGKSPDVFVRRNPAEPRISDLHGDTDKINNRIEIISSLLLRDKIKNNLQYSIGLIKTAFRELFFLLNSGRSFKLHTLRTFKPHAQTNREIHKVYRQLVISYYLTSFHFLLYRVYKKFFYPRKADVVLRYESKYRSAMNQGETMQLLAVLSSIK